ncbi:MAG: alpha-1,2-fucosyltransferase [Dysgonamonadaceae bacterium]|nr:alpha-1,2-fucosyltransferase [Dysgonamonadaceae bacterium]
MFQYAFFLAKKQYNNNIALSDYFIHFEPIIQHNGCELNNLFNTVICKNRLLKNIIWLIRKLWIFKHKKGFRKISSFAIFALKKLNINTIGETKTGTVDYDVIPKHSGFSVYIGCWATEKYFCSNRKEILNAFSFEHLEKSRQTLEILHLIEQTNSISIHIRRGDYLLHERFGNISTPLFYEKAIAEMQKRIGSPVFFVFSNDMQWVRENMHIPNSHYIDWNQGKNSWQDMFLMSKCKHNIIANSTFSWWAAWLNQFPEKTVIAPSRFLNDAETPDLIPDTWIKITV